MTKLLGLAAASLCVSAGLLLLGSLTSADESPPSAATQRRPYAKLQSPLANLASTYDILGIGPTLVAATERDLLADGDSIRVVVRARSGEAAAALSAVRAVGGEAELVHGDRVQAVVPLSGLGQLAASEAIRFVHEPLRSLPHEVTSEGVSLSGVAPWRSAGLTGTGTKVAVLDSGFQGYTSLLGGELPSNVVTRSFRADGRMDDGEHGTACAEIVHDMAPAAQLYLVASQTQDEDLEAISWLMEQGIDVISASSGNPIWGPGDGTGPTHDKIDEATDRGILWVNAAGNFGDSHWSGGWRDQDGDDVLEFQSGDESNTFTLAGGESAMVYLRWNDAWDHSCNDYDLAIYDSLGLEAGQSSNPQDCNTFEPWEAAEVNTSVLDKEFSIKIQRYDADGQANFDLFVHCLTCSALEHVTPEGSISAPADAASALTVGAVDVASPTTIEDFSSRGPTEDGRIKPDLVAPDQVSTKAYNPEPFGGTSASAPHVAGAAALVKQANPSFSPQQLKAFLEGRAVDLGSSGKDNIYGSGRLSLGAVPPPGPSPTPTGTPAPTATPTPPFAAGTTRTVNLSPPGWHDLAWSGADGTDPATAMACIPGKYSIAYVWEGPTAGFKRYVEGCSLSGICNMAPLNRYDSMLVLTSADATCQMPVAASTPGATRAVNLSPPGWHDLAWSGLDGTDPGAALSCMSGKYSIAYAWEGPTAGFKRYVAGCSVPGICNMGPLNRYDSMLVLTSADATCQMPVGPASTGTPTSTATPVKTATPMGTPTPTATRTPTPTPTPVACPESGPYSGLTLGGGEFGLDVEDCGISGVWSATEWVPCTESLDATPGMVEVVYDPPLPIVNGAFSGQGNQSGSGPEGSLWHTTLQFSGSFRSDQEARGEVLIQIEVTGFPGHDTIYCDSGLLSWRAFLE